MGKTATSKGHTGARFKDAKCFVRPAEAKGNAGAVWKSFNNFCVDKNGKDLPQTAWKAGAASNNKCKQECMKKKECTAYEWYNKGFDGSKCHLMLGKTATSKGHTGARWKDAKCFVKPAAKPTVNKCKCNNGKAVTGAACTKKNANICKTCNVGFALNDKKGCAKTAAAKACNAKKGPQKGNCPVAACPAPPKGCKAKKVFQFQANGNCCPKPCNFVDAKGKVCKKVVNKCKCNNGKPVTGAACTKKNANICKTCNNGFALTDKKLCAKAAAAKAWKSFNNFCVDKNGK